MKMGMNENNWKEKKLKNAYAESAFLKQNEEKAKLPLRY